MPAKKRPDNAIIQTPRVIVYVHRRQASSYKGLVSCLSSQSVLGAAPGIGAQLKVDITSAFKLHQPSRLVMGWQKNTGYSGRCSGNFRLPGRSVGALYRVLWSVVRSCHERSIEFAR